MDMLSISLILLSSLAIVLSYYFKNTRVNGKRCFKTRAPEPPGAWPFIGHLHHLGGKTPVARILGAMADKHGPIFSVRLGSHPAVVVSSSEMIKDCFSTNDQTFASRPSMAVTKYLGYNGAAFALAPYGTYWRYLRKMVTVELLSSHRLQKLSHVRVSELDQSIKDLYLRCEKNGEFSKITLSKWFEDLTFNITMRMLIGKRFSNSKNGVEERHFKEAIKKALYLSGVFVVSDAIPSLEWMDIGGYLKAMKTTAKDIDKVLENWLKKRVQNRKESKTEGESDFMDVMLSTFLETEIESGCNRDTIIKATLLVSTLFSLSLNNCYS